MQHKKPFQLVGLMLMLALLAACSSQSKIKPPPPGTSRIGIPVTEPSLIPKDEPRSTRVTRGNRSPYQVFGKTYYVLPSAANYHAEGLASWYGDKFHGLQTSTGEIYNMYALSAAHKSLPIPCYARITNLQNGRQIVVRINDRGPFHEDRLIDLSYGAAIQLGFAEEGLAQVRIEVINAPATPMTPETVASSAPQPAPRPVMNLVSNPPLSIRKPAPAASIAAAPVENDQNIYLQAGAFSKREAAAALAARLGGMVKHPVVVSAAGVQKKDSLFRVRIGPIATASELQQVQTLIGQQGIASSFAFKQ